MKLTVFAKKRTGKDNRTFYVYIAKMYKKSGEEITSTLKFKDNVGTPRVEDCPIIINVNKEDANLSKRKLTNSENGTTYDQYTLWVNAWTPTNEKFVDHSLDDFE